MKIQDCRFSLGNHRLRKHIGLHFQLSSETVSRIRSTQYQQRIAIATSWHWTEAPNGDTKPKLSERDKTPGHHTETRNETPRLQNEASHRPRHYSQTPPHRNTRPQSGHRHRSCRTHGSLPDLDTNQDIRQKHCVHPLQSR